MARSPNKTELLDHLGAKTDFCDVFDREALIQAVLDFEPDVLLNELTDLPDDAAQISEHADLNARRLMSAMSRHCEVRSLPSADITVDQLSLSFCPKTVSLPAGLSLPGEALLSPLSCSASNVVRNSIQAPPNGNQIGGSHPIYFPFLNLRNDGEVLGGGFDFSMRKAEFRVTALD